jgi:nucleotide-binding universal stress UspA family protein
MRARSVVCGVDFSRASAKALRSAAAIARRGRGQLVVLFVEDPMLAAAARAAGDRRASTASTTPALERFVKKSLGRAARPRLHLAVAVGDAADEILKTATRRRADLVVLSTHGSGRGSMARLWLGSTAERVLRHTRVPVLAVPS